MFNTHVCDCGLCWESEKHDCEMRYRSAVRCLCDRVLLTWEGRFFYTFKQSVGEPIVQVKVKAVEASSTTAN